MRAECVDVWHCMQCDRGLRTTNDVIMSIQMTVLEIIIAVLHRLHNVWHAGLCHVHISLTLLDIGYSVRSSVNADLLS